MRHPGTGRDVPRLLADFGMQRKGELTWVKAWSLGENKAEPKKDEPKK